MAGRALDPPATVRTAVDQVRILAVAVLGAVRLDRGQPGLLDELEQARGRGGPGLGARIHRAFAARGLDQKLRIHAGGAGGAPDRRLDPARGWNRSDVHAPDAAGSWLTIP